MTSPRPCRPGRSGAGNLAPGITGSSWYAGNRGVATHSAPVPGGDAAQGTSPLRPPGPIRKLRPRRHPVPGPRMPLLVTLHGRGPGALTDRAGRHVHRPRRVHRRHPPRRLTDRDRLRLHRLAAPSQAPRQPEPPAPPPAPARPSAASTQAPRQTGTARPSTACASTGCPPPAAPVTQAPRQPEPPAPPRRAGASVSGIPPGASLTGTAPASTACGGDPGAPPAGTACASTGAGASTGGIHPGSPLTGTACASTRPARPPAASTQAPR